MTELTQERLKELLSYDLETGIFINFTQRSSRAKKNVIAGNKRVDCYIQIGLDKKNHLAHRLAWLYVYGKFPEKHLDRINENPSDNRINNLRLSTNRENSQNISKPNKNNASGYLGVYWNKKDKKWQASITINRKLKNLGYFNTAEESSEAYLKAKQKLHIFWVEEKVA